MIGTPTERVGVRRKRERAHSPVFVANRMIRMPAERLGVGRKRERALSSRQVTSPDTMKEKPVSFLDNLENNLKALESREEKDPEKLRRDQQRREAERNAALARSPHVEALKQSPFTSELLTQCRTIGHAQRVLVRFTWIGDNLRLDAGPKRLELMPTADGIQALYFLDGVEQNKSTLNLESDDPVKLARDWLNC